MSPIEKVRSELEEFEAEAARLRARLSELDVEMSERRTVIRHLERIAAAGDQASSQEKDMQLEPTTETPCEAETDDSFRGKGLSAAATLVLQSERRNMRIVEITRILMQNGVKFAARKPEMSVDWALKRAAESGHVIKVARGVWAAAVYGSAPHDDLPKLGKHSATTKAGLALAKERGVRLGPPPKVTEEHRLLAKSLFERGAKIAEIAKACGVSPGGIARRIKEWRGEGRFPERKRRLKGAKAKAESGNRDRGMLH